MALQLLTAGCHITIFLASSFHCNCIAFGFQSYQLRDLQLKYSQDNQSVTFKSWLTSLLPSRRVLNSFEHSIVASQLSGI